MFLDSASTLQLTSDVAGTGTDLKFVLSGSTDTGAAVSGYVNEGQSNGTTAVAMAVAPAVGQFRRIVYVSIRNAGTASRIARVQIQGGVLTVVREVSLSPGESLEFTGRGWRVLDSNGREEYSTPSDAVAAGETVTIFKTGTAAEAAASWYGFKKDAGSPGAWVPGTPGLNGIVASDTTAGCLPIANPSVQKRLFPPVMSSSTAGLIMLYDLLWYNTGAVVTTTTEQLIVTPTFPARDINGTTNGRGLTIGLYFTTASTNAGAIPTSTVRYTNSDGVANRTATLVAAAGSQIPATPVIGTIVWFSLQAGDVGVRSIEGLTLGTSLVTGAISLFVARWLSSTPVTAANIGTLPPVNAQGVTLFPNSAVFPALLCSATTATAIVGNVTTAPS